MRNPATDVSESFDTGQSEDQLPKPRKSVSVIIVSYWTGPLLVRSVLSALRQPEVAEVIVVNNGNWSDAMDRLTALAGEEAGKLRILSGQGNVGFAKGCNIGAEAATGKYLFILNPDAILPDHAVAELLREAATFEGEWVVGGKLINPDGTEQAGSRRSPLTPWTAFVELTKLYKFAPQHPYFRRLNMHQDPCPDDTIPIPVISGACMLMTRETFFSIGGMNEDYFLHVEDVDFCLRLRNKGGDVYFAPGVSVLHFKSSSRSSRLRVEAMKAQSLVRYFWAHFRKPYPWPFLVLVSIAVWAAFFLKSIGILTRRLFSLLGFRAKAGRNGIVRARSLASKRNAR